MSRGYAAILIGNHDFLTAQKAQRIDSVINEVNLRGWHMFSDNGKSNATQQAKYLINY